MTSDFGGTLHMNTKTNKTSHFNHEKTSFLVSLDDKNLPVLAHRNIQANLGLDYMVHYHIR